MKNSEAPAFPVQVGMLQYGGISTLEYFAARAPREVPDWFAPVMGKTPEAPGYPPIKGFSEAFESWENWEGEEGWDKDINPGTASMVRQFVSENADYRKKLKEFAEEKYRQTIAQWPWAWAKMVLEAKP